MLQQLVLKIFFPCTTSFLVCNTDRIIQGCSEHSDSPCITGVEQPFKLESRPNLLVQQSVKQWGTGSGESLNHFRDGCVHCITASDNYRVPQLWYTQKLHQQICMLCLCYLHSELVAKTRGLGKGDASLWGLATSVMETVRSGIRSTSVSVR